MRRSQVGTRWRLFLHLGPILFLGCTGGPTNDVGPPRQTAALAVSLRESQPIAIGRGGVCVAELRNSGASVLRIVDVKTKCGCTSTQLDRREIKPGEAALLTMTLTPQLHPGRFHHTVNVILDDGSECSVPLEGEVVSLFSVAPLTLTVRPNPATHAPGRSEFTFANHDKADVRIEGIDIAPAAAELVVEPSSMSLAPGAAGRFSVVGRPNGLVRKTYEIRIRTSQAVERFVLLHCHVVPAPGVQIVPESLNLGYVPPERFAQETPFVTFRILTDPPGGWFIEDVSVPEHFAAGRPTSISDGTFTLSLSPRAGHPPPQDLAGSMRISLVHRGDDLRDIAVVPIRGLLKNAGGG
jgi:hypothetical protein